jgi:oligopeptide/dipeptide ABC transporter ATP-binding protein
LTPDPAVERGRAKIILRGDVPSPMNPPSGCRFRTRCPLTAPICIQQRPTLRDAGGAHQVACHFPDAARRLQEASTGSAEAVAAC